ncbi:MAG: hypothetical protein WC707_02205 [Candidatus Babeliaceae bacterium]|jgi:hypothetical protein
MCVLLCFSHALFFAQEKIAQQELQTIARAIWRNESGCDTKKLLWWNKGEDFLSLGIGHFIWYPQMHVTHFKEIFPEFIAYMRKKKSKLPGKIQEQACPWSSREEFLRAQVDGATQELHDFIYSTISEQADFMLIQLQKTLIDIQKHVNKKQKKIIQKKIDSLMLIPAGRYALLDYLNFKGSGLDKHEQYAGQGWGLLQVLIAMDSNVHDPVQAFSAAAQERLRLRVANAPRERHEERWLKGWLNRIATYKNFM